jgi:CheY-like chemotaxis protein
MNSILVVDDEHDIVFAVGLVLEEFGYRMISAANGKDALARMAEAKPALVLMDIMMPVLGGLETLKLIKSDPEYSDVPVVMMSAMIPRVSREDYPWDDFLRKPFELDGLQEVIDRLAIKKGGKNV